MQVSDSLTKQLHIGFKEIREQNEELRALILKIEHTSNKTNRDLKTMILESRDLATRHNQQIQSALGQISTQLDGQTVSAYKTYVNDVDSKIRKVRSKALSTHNFMGANKNLLAGYIQSVLVQLEKTQHRAEDKYAADSLQRMNNYADFYPYFIEHDGQAPLVNIRAYLSAVATSGAILSQFSRAHAPDDSLPQEFQLEELIIPELDKLKQYGTSLYSSMVQQRDKIWQTLSKVQIEAQKNYKQISTELMQGLEDWRSKIKPAREPSTLDQLNQLKERMLVSEFVGSGKFDLLRTLNTSLSAQGDIPTGLFKSLCGKMAAVHTGYTVLNAALIGITCAFPLFLAISAPVAIASNAQCIGVYGDALNLLNELKGENFNIYRLIGQAKQFTDFLGRHGDLVAYLDEHNKLVVQVMDGVSYSKIKNLKVSELRQLNQAPLYPHIKAPLKIVITNQAFDFEEYIDSDGDLERMPVRKSTVKVYLNQIEIKSIPELPYRASYLMDYDKVTRAHIIHYFNLIEETKKNPASEYAVIYSSQELNKELIPLRFSKEYLKHLEQNVLISEFRKTEQLGSGTISITYSLGVIPDEYGVAQTNIILNYNFTTQERHTVSICHIPVARFDNKVVHSFSKLTINHNGLYETQINYNEFLLFVMHGTPDGAGLAAKGSIDFNGQRIIGAVELPFVGLEFILSTLRNKVFYYQLDRYDELTSNAFYKFDGTANTQIHSFIQDDLVYWPGEGASLQQNQNIDPNMISNLMNKDAIVQCFKKLYTIFEHGAVHLQLAFNLDVKSAEWLMEKYVMEHPDKLKALAQKHFDRFYHLFEQLTAESFIRNSNTLSDAFAPYLGGENRLRETLAQELSTLNTYIEEVSNFTLNFPPLRPKASQSHSASSQRSDTWDYSAGFGLFSSTFKSIEDPRRSLTKVIQPLGLKITDVKSDGNCFFHAVSHQMISRGLMTYTHTELRAEALNWMLTHEEQYAFIVHLSEETAEMAINRYIDEHLRSGTWADHNMVQALALACNLNMVIIRPNGDITVIKAADEGEIIYLGFFPEQHYVSLSGNYPHESLINAVELAEVINIEGARQYRRAQ